MTATREDLERYAAVSRTIGYEHAAILAESAAAKLPAAATTGDALSEADDAKLVLRAADYLRQYTMFGGLADQLVDVSERLRATLANGAGEAERLRAERDQYLSALSAVAPHGKTFQLTLPYQGNLPMYGRVALVSPPWIDDGENEDGTRDVLNETYDEDTCHGETEQIGFFVTEEWLADREEERDSLRAELTQSKLLHAAWESVGRTVLEHLGIRPGFHPCFDDMRGNAREKIEALRAELDEARRERDEARGAASGYANCGERVADTIERLAKERDEARGRSEALTKRLNAWWDWANETVASGHDTAENLRAAIGQKLAAAKPERLGRRETVEAAIRYAEANYSHTSYASEMLRAYAATLSPDTEPVFTSGDADLVRDEANGHSPTVVNGRFRRLHDIADRLSRLVQSREEAGR